MCVLLTGRSAGGVKVLGQEKLDIIWKLLASGLIASTFENGATRCLTEPCDKQKHILQNLVITQI